MIRTGGTDVEFVFQKVQGSVRAKQEAIDPRRSKRQRDWLRFWVLILGWLAYLLLRTTQPPPGIGCDPPHQQRLTLSAASTR